MAGNSLNMPLDGVRVLDLTQALAGPFATRFLGDLGAEVIKIEQPGVGDPSRQFGPYFLEGESAYFLGFNRNKQGVTINLRSEKGRSVFYDLVSVSDVVFDNYRPSVLKRLGLGFEDLKQHNPTVISCSLSGFGHGNGYSEKPAFDGIIQAMGGGMSVTGEPGRPPMLMGFAVGDLAGGYTASLAIVSALFDRQRSGLGRRLDISLLDSQISLQGHLGQFALTSKQSPQPIGSGQPGNVPVGAFKCSDGVYVQVHCATQRFWENMASMLSSEVSSLKEISSDPRFSTPDDRRLNRDTLIDLIRNAFLDKTSVQWLALLFDADVPSGPVNDLVQAQQDPEVQARHMVVEMDHPISGLYRAAGNPIKMGQKEVFNPAPALGEHTEGTLVSLLGYSTNDVNQLRDAGVI